MCGYPFPSHRDVAQLGSAPRSGRGGPGFKSPHPDSQVPESSGIPGPGRVRDLIDVHTFPTVWESAGGGRPDGSLEFGTVVDRWGQPVHLVLMHDTENPLTKLDPLIGIEELAAYLGLPKQTIYDWRVDGKGPRAYRFGKRLRFAVGDVREWMESQREPVSPRPPTNDRG